ATGEAVTPPLQPHGFGPYNDVAFSPDGGRIVTTDVGGRILVWNATNGELLVRGGSTDPWQCRTAYFSPDGSRITGAYGNGMVRVWKAEADHLVWQRMVGHRFGVNDVSFSPDGRFILTAGD